MKASRITDACECLCVVEGKEGRKGKGKAEFDKSRLCQPARAGVNSEYKKTIDTDS